MFRAAVVILAALVALGAGAAASAVSSKVPKPLDRTGPLLISADDEGGPVKPKSPPGPAKPATLVRVDEKARAVYVPVTFSRAKGLVEWLLAASKKHPVTSVLVTEHSAKDVAAALAKIGLKGGARPQLVEDDRARPAAGPALELTVVVRRADGKEERTPAARFLSRKSGGEPVGEGAWVYVGPQVLREDDVDIDVTDLSGSVATTNPRDLSAIVYWIPKTPDGGPLYVTAYYISNVPLPQTDGATVELEIKPAAPPAPPKAE